MKWFAVLVPVVCAVCVHAADKPRVFLETRLLTGQTAEKIGRGAIEACTAKGYKVGVSVVARDGSLLYFTRHPLAGPHTVAVSRAKAYTSATTGVVSQAVRDNPGLDHFERLTSVRGGVPIEVGGYFYGGVGVSGATPEDDEKCARAGLRPVVEELEFSE